MSGSRAKRPRAITLSTWALLALAVVQFAALVVPSIPMFTPLGAFAIAICLGAGSAAYEVLASRCDPQPAELPAPAPTPALKLHAPDALPGQCPVCGMEDVKQLAKQDRELGGERVVPYGKHLAHWDCAELLPCAPARIPLPPYTPHAVAELTDAIPAGVPMLLLDRYVPPGFYIVGSSDEQFWNVWEEFTVHVTGCARTASGYAAHLTFPAVCAAPAGQTLRPKPTSRDVPPAQPVTGLAHMSTPRSIIFLPR
jgi:hypothetical protein